MVGAERVLNRLEVAKAHTVLDLGCGDGFHFQAALTRGPRLLVAADISYGCVASLKNRCGSTGSQAAFLCADGRDDPFADCSFDRIICSLVLHLLPLETALPELFRILKPGGRMYVRVPMLTWGRSLDVLKSLPDIRLSAYVAAHLLAGLRFLVTGRQTRSRIVRRDRWSQYVPRRRFEHVIREAGFQVEQLLVVHPKPYRASIEAWLTKA